MVLVGCVGDSGTPTDGGTDSTTSCGAGTKLCNGACVKLGDPTTGCNATTCSACPDDPTRHQASACDTTNVCTYATTCATGWGDCDGNPANGCEANTGTDINNCGACKHVCGVQNASAAPTCSAGKCSFNCNAGYAACGTDDQGCNTNIGGTDANNCGACNHSCQGGTCKAGACQPVQLATATLPGPIVADTGPTGLVYFGDHSNDASTAKTIWKVPKDASAAASGLFVNEPYSYCSGNVWTSGLTISGTNLYWSVQGTNSTACAQRVRFGPKGGGTAQWLPSTGAGWMGMNGIGSDTNSVFVCMYWDTHNIEAIDIVPGSSRDLFYDPSTPNPVTSGLAVDSIATGNVYFSRDDGVSRIAKDGKSSRVVISNYTTAGALATDDVDVFFADSGSHKIYRIPGASTCTGPTACPPVSLTTGAYDGVSVAVDATYVYWAEENMPSYGNGLVMRIHKDGSDKGTATQLATGAFPDAVTLDDVALYWTDKYGGIAGNSYPTGTTYKIAK